MDIRTTQDIDDDMPAGTVVQNVEDRGDHWRGLWCSMWGSYFVEIPKDAAVPA